MRIEEHIHLAPYTTFKIGGKARYFCRVETVEELAEASEFARGRKLPVFILGGGSNILVSDDGFPGLVVKMDMLGLEFVSRGKKTEMTAGAGEIWDDAVRLSVDKNLYGLENLSGIPGSVGAAPVQNIGAYGTELSEHVTAVEVFDPAKRETYILERKECRFGYRDSIFKHAGSHLVVTKAMFLLERTGEPNLSYRDVAERLSRRGGVPSLAEVRSAVLAIRAGKFPDLSKTGTAGSFFKNPVVSRSVYEKLHEKYPELPAFPEGKARVKLSLAWIIDHVCRLKTRSVGGAFVSPKQALVICNRKNARARDVSELASEIAESVRTHTGIVIEPEVRIL